MTEDQKKLVLKLVESVKIATQSMVPSDEQLEAVWNNISAVITEVTSEE